VVRRHSWRLPPFSCSCPRSAPHCQVTGRHLITLNGRPRRAALPPRTARRRHIPRQARRGADPVSDLLTNSGDSD
jgi:hypothetical protein